MMVISALSHLDHGLTAEHIRFILYRFKDRDAFFIDTFEMPAHLPSLECGLYGPAVGYVEVFEPDVRYAKRGGRTYESRVVDMAPRATRLLTVIAGPHSDTPDSPVTPCLLYTAFGGPATPKECGDPSLSPDERGKSLEFWSVHALASGIVCPAADSFSELRCVLPGGHGGHHQYEFPVSAK